jgi:hypothetical protein
MLHILRRYEVGVEQIHAIGLRQGNREAVNREHDLPKPYTRASMRALALYQPLSLQV